LGRVATLATLVGSIAWLVTAGCSSSKDDNNASTIEAGGACPTTLEAAEGKACQNEGLTCEIVYNCSSFLNQTSPCKCTAGKFVCVDNKGTEIADPTNPPCTSPGGGNDKECPSDENGAAGQGCKTTGLVCNYAGKVCPETGKPTTDTCQCSPDDTGALKFNCEPRLCNPPSDGGVPIPLDAAKD
jgi:hypothetical protein